MKFANNQPRRRCSGFRGACAVLVMAAAAQPSFAALCERHNLGAGFLHIAPHSSSGPLVISEIGGQPANITQDGTGFRALSANTLLLLAECQRNERLKFRFAFGVPPSHDLEGTGTLAPVGVIGKGQQWSPTLLAIYTFTPGQQTVRPFIGGGLNYTFFKRERITNDAFRQANFGPNAVTRVDLSPSWNPVATAGVVFRLGAAVSVEAGISYAPLKTRATVKADNTAQGVPVTVVSELKNRAIISSVALSYSWGR